MSLKEKWQELPSNARLGIMVGGIFVSVIALAAVVQSTRGPTREIAGQPIGANKPANFRVPTARETGVDDLLQSKVSRRAPWAWITESRRWRPIASCCSVSFRRCAALRVQTVDQTLWDEVQRLSRELERLKFSGGGAVAQGLVGPDGLLVVGEMGNRFLPTPCRCFLVRSASSTFSQCGASVRTTAPNSACSRGSDPKEEKEVKRRQGADCLPANGKSVRRFLAQRYGRSDSPTRRAKDPVPAVLRVKTDGFPQSLHHDVRECFVIISGFGDLRANEPLCAPKVSRASRRRCGYRRSDGRVCRR